MAHLTTLPADIEATVEQLLHLPLEQRIEIGERLLASVPPDVEDFWDREIARRIEDHEAGRTRSHDAADVMARLRRKIDEAGQNQ
jgi:hypothetical protein